MGQPWRKTNVKASSLKKWKKLCKPLVRSTGTAQRARNKLRVRTAEPLLPPKQIRALKFLWLEIDDHIWNNKKNVWAVSKADGERLEFRISLKCHLSWQELANWLRDEPLREQAPKRPQQKRWEVLWNKTDRQRHELVSPHLYDIKRSQAQPHSQYELQSPEKSTRKTKREKNIYECPY